MADVFKFPAGGYEVTVCKKQDILDCIDDNILDKEVALAILEQCEQDAARFIQEGKWTGIPYIGSIRIPPIKQREQTPEQQELIQTAKENLSKEDYIFFRKSLIKENAKQEKIDRMYNYFTSIIINRNRKVYNKLCKTNGELYSRIFLYTCRNLKASGGERILNNETELTDR